MKPTAPTYFSALIKQSHAVPTQPAYWYNLNNSLLSWALSERLAAHAGPVLVITPDSQSADKLELELGFFQPKAMRYRFPSWETLPYDSFSPHEDLISERLQLLARLPHLQQGTVICAAATLMHPVCPQSHLHAHSFVLDCGDTLDVEALRKQLTEAGYYAVSQVMTHGEFALRGSLIDIFPMGATQPYRIDLFDNEVESIRTFDPSTQRSLTKIDKINLLPAREFSLSKDSISQFREAFRAQFSGDASACAIYKDISQGIAPSGIEYYLPLFYPKINYLSDYLPDNTLVITLGDTQTQLQQFYQEVESRYEQYRHDILRPILEPSSLFLKAPALFERLNHFAQLRVHFENNIQAASIQTQALPPIKINAQLSEPLHSLQNFLQTHHTQRILFCAESAGRREALLGLLAPLHLDLQGFEHWQAFANSDAQLGILVGPLANGFHLPEQNFILITETELFGQQIVAQRRKGRKEVDAESIIKSLAELKTGDFVVHIDHGIGRYIGLQTIPVGDYDAEFLTLEYAENDKLYVPVDALHLISRYSGLDESHIHLHKLGGQSWQRQKKKAADKIKDVAAELLHIYAQREAKTGFAYPAPDSHYHTFASSFLFEETADQSQAIEQVIQDMSAARSMDRLICGDVGFGKTEVALRAAFLAVQGGKQVALLVPTTLLSQQHYETFTDRFADWPINIAVLSRFRTTKQQTDDLEALSQGKVDIIIGTHALLNPRVKFKDLGLTIIDEEHRFGVRQKDKLKALRAEVDILALTATPIPRTLNMAMHSVRDLSIIATPPKKRLAVKTFVSTRHDTTIREALLREIMRGGQVYYLHNEVSTIENIAEQLRELVPEARIQVAHGQMRERALEKIMADFYHQRFNVLLCTTIIENGIDIPTANTIIMDRADKLGLAQLHQLRGRVGRSHHQAYAYLFTPPPKQMTRDAHKRLEAIAAVEELGVGFTLATHDLEIRGAGEFLGEEQSGHMQAIGFSLYMELLERTVKSLQAGNTPDDLLNAQPSIDINLRVPALIPEDYLGDVHSRLVLYKRIANASQADKLAELRVEMIDRFGLLPEPVKNLFTISELRLKAKALGITKMDIGPAQGKVEFAKTVHIDPKVLIQMIQQQSEVYQLQGGEKLKITLALKQAHERLEFAEDLLGHLSN